MSEEVIEGYKVFNNDWTCRDFKYEVGETYKHGGEIKWCESGFHFCKKLKDCFNYYEMVPWNKIARVKAVGEVIDKGDDSKVVTEII